MKNKIQNVLITALVAVSLASCSLDEYNPSGVTAETVFSTPEGYETLVNACYVNIRGQFYGSEDILLMTEGGTDIWFNNAKSFYNKQVTRYMDLSSDLTKFNNPWKRLYDPINLCNAAIGRADAAGYASETERDTKVAEAHFLRAYYYWILVENWGGVSLRTEETTGPVLNAVRSSVGDFYDVIFEDLNFATEHLPLIQTDLGRADQKAAWAFKARLALTRAAYFEPSSTEAMEYFTMARDAALHVIDNRATYGVDLYADFNQLFAAANNKANTECLFKVTNSATSAYNLDDTTNRLHLWFLSDYSSYCGVALNKIDGNDKSKSRGPGLMPTLFLLDLFDETRDARYNASFQEAYFCNYVKDPTNPLAGAKKKWTTAEITKFRKNPAVIKTSTTINTGDTALLFTKRSIANKATVNYGVVDKDDIYATENNDSIRTTELNVFHPALKRYLDPDRENPESDYSTKDVILMRLAEMYLIAAEAEYRLGNNGPAKNYVNVLRTRAAIKTPVDKTSAMQVSESDLSTEFFLAERARELCGEHIRWFDLVRVFRRDPDGWVNWIKTHNSNIDKIEKHHMLRPIPISEIETLLNWEEFGQNEGY